MAHPLTESEHIALAALGKEELATFARLHQRCAEETDNDKLLSPIINELAHMTFDQMDALILLYHENFFPLGEKPAAPPPVVPDELAEELPEDPKAPIFCEVCKMDLTGRTQFEDHLSGKKHKKKAATTSPNADEYWDKWKPQRSQRR